MPPRFANRMKYVKPSAIRDLLQFGSDPRIISFAGGYPDASLFPLDQLASVFQSVIGDNGRTSLQYTVSNGIQKLREQITTRMSREGVACTAEEVLILQGGQQGLDLVGKMFIDRGDVVITENPTFLGALIAFDPYEPRYAAVRVDDDGMDMDDLERVLKEHGGAKLLYTVPDFQNPTGVTMSLARRERLMELASEFDLMILEDTPYREIRYQGEPVPPLKSLDREGRVIYLGSFSKILAPGLRLGWAIGTPELIDELGLLKLAADTQSGTLNMYAVSLFLDTYDIEAHIGTIRETYRRKRNLMLETIRHTFPQNISFTEPNGGMFTWLTFPQGFDAARFMLEKALPIAKVAYVPGATLFPITQEANHARFSYCAQSDDAIVRGMTMLGELLKSELS